MNYYNTFIQVAPDSPVNQAVIPVAKDQKKSIPILEYELLSENPYTFTQEDLIFEVYIRHNGIDAKQLTEHREEIRAKLFEKPHACLRASALPKKYGWGLHFNKDGKIALYTMESKEYHSFVESPDDIQLLKAMRNKRE